jgi:hypothetical protein
VAARKAGARKAVHNITKATNLRCIEPTNQSERIAPSIAKHHPGH